jgi:hypothetical protein
VRASASLEFGTPKPLFALPARRTAFYWSYDAAPDGARFMVLAPLETKQEPLALILNWSEVLKK